MNITLEFRISNHALRFLYNGFVASALDNSSLMKCKGTEITSPKTTSVACDTEFDLIYGTNSTSLFIGRMIGSHIISCINIIHFIHSKGICRRILHYTYAVWIYFCHCFCSKCIRILILYSVAFGIGSLIIFNSFKIWKNYGV